MIKVKDNIKEQITNINYPVFRNIQSTLNWKIIMSHLYLSAINGKRYSSKSLRSIVEKEKFIDTQLKWIKKTYIDDIINHVFTRLNVNKISDKLSTLDNPNIVRTALNLVNKYAITDDILTEHFNETIYIFFPQITYSNHRLYIHPFFELSDKDALTLYSLLFEVNNYTLFRFDINGALIRAVIEYVFGKYVYEEYGFNKNEDIYLSLMHLCNKKYIRDDFKKVIIATIYSQSLNAFEQLYTNEPSLKRFMQVIIDKNLNTDRLNVILGEYITEHLKDIFDMKENYLLYINNDGGFGISLNEIEPKKGLLNIEIFNGGAKI